MIFLFVLFNRDGRKIAYRHGRFKVVKFLDSLLKPVKVIEPEKAPKKVEVKAEKPQNERAQYRNQLPNANDNQKVQIQRPKHKPAQQQQQQQKYKPRTKLDSESQERHHHHHQSNRHAQKNPPPPPPPPQREERHHHHHHHHHHDNQNQNHYGQNNNNPPTYYQYQYPKVTNLQKERPTNTNNRPQDGAYPRYKFENHVMVRVY